MGSFCKFKGEAPISLPNDPDFRIHRPEKPIVDQIWCSPVIIQPNPYFDWSICTQFSLSEVRESLERRKRTRFENKNKEQARTSVF